MNRALSAFIVLLVIIGAAIAAMLLVLNGLVALLAASIGQGQAQVVIGFLVLALLALLLRRRRKAPIPTAHGLPAQLPEVVRQRPLESCGMAMLAGIVIGARPEVLGEASRALTEARQTLKDLEHGA